MFLPFYQKIIIMFLPCSSWFSGFKLFGTVAMLSMQIQISIDELTIYDKVQTKFL